MQGAAAHTRLSNTESKPRNSRLLCWRLRPNEIEQAVQTAAWDTARGERTWKIASDARA